MEDKGQAREEDLSLHFHGLSHLTASPKHRKLLIFTVILVKNTVTKKLREVEECLSAVLF